MPLSYRFQLLLGGVCLLATLPAFSQTSCSNPHQLTNADLPYASPQVGAATALTTCGMGNNYDINSISACGNSNENGEDYVFEFTSTQDVCVDIELSFQSGSTSQSVFVYDGCPDDPSTRCKEYDTGGNPREIMGLTFENGTTHYIVISRSTGCSSFQLEIAEAAGPLGSTCCNPYPVTSDSLPFNKTWTTCGYGDNYDQSSIGMNGCGTSTLCSYAQDEDIVIEYVHPSTGPLSVDILDGSIEPGLDPGVYLLDGCPDVASSTVLGVATYNNNSTGTFGVTMYKPSLPPGVYYIVLGTKGSPNCSSMDVAIHGPIGPIALIDGITATDHYCTQAPGSATVSASGGTPPYTYDWDSNTGNQTASTATGLSAGTYFVTVTDVQGGYHIGNVTVNQGASVALQQGTVVPENCNLQNGSAEAVAISGPAPIDYLWDAPAQNQTTATATALGLGTYTVTASDDNGCTATQTISVTRINAFDVTVSATAESCQTVADGSAMAVTTGGTAPFTYLWDSGTGGQTTSTATGLSAPYQYSVSVSDAAGCTASNSATVAGPVAVTATASSTPESCGLQDGTVTITVSSGVAPYTYSLQGHPDQSTSNSSTGFLGVAAGTWSFDVLDNQGCTTSVPATVSVGATGGPNINITTVDTDCNGAVGTATATASGAAPPFTYLWDAAAANQATATATGLAAGSYNVTATDNNGCIQIASATIGPDPLTVLASETAGDICSTGDGAATALAAGGVAPYTYQWDATAGNQTTAVAANLNASAYSVSVTDNLGCLVVGSVSIGGPIGTPLSVSISATAESCVGDANGTATATAVGGSAPYTYHWDAGTGGQTTATATGLGAPYTYSVTVSDADGCSASNSQAASNPPTLVSASAAATNATCSTSLDGAIAISTTSGVAPFQYKLGSQSTWQSGASFAGLIAADYEVFVQDAQGCGTVSPWIVQVASQGIVPSNSLTIDATPNCGQFDGAISANASGGAGNYTYVWSANANGQTTQSVTGLSGGTYTTTVTDAIGCTASASTNLQDIAIDLQFAFVNLPEGCNQQNGEAQATVTGGTPPYTYSWSNGATTATASGLTAGTYTLTATDANGCSDSETISVISAGQLSVTFSHVDASCGVADGSVTAIVAGGYTAPLTYQWDANAANQTFPTADHLLSGDYSVTITDAAGNCAIEMATVGSNGQGTFDHQACAFQIPSISGYCSAADAFTTVGATPDGPSGSCWTSGPHNNVWFRFVATGTFAHINVVPTGLSNSIKYTNVALFDDANNEVACNSFTTGFGHVELGSNSLIAGNTYYILVDNLPGGKGRFQLCIDDMPTYDFQVGAVDLTGLNGCTGTVYSTIGATADGQGGSCWDYPVVNNRWFKFQATTQYANITVVQAETSTPTPPLKYTLLAVYDDAGNQIGCNQFEFGNDQVTASLGGLTVSDWYYIEVDNLFGASGRFGICMNDQVTFDHIAGAEPLPSTNYCTGLGAFGNFDATPDGSAPSCWYDGPNNNVWFSFVPTSPNLEIALRSVAGVNNLEYPYLAVWDHTLNEIGCSAFNTAYEDQVITFGTLNVGETYYISVDNAPGGQGLFELCLNDGVGYDFYEGAEHLTVFDNTCELQAYTTIGASPDQIAGSCWPYGPFNNRWFRFIAPSQTVLVRVWTQNQYGTMRYPMLATYDDQLNEIGCMIFGSGNTQVVYSTMSELTVGKEYYIEVDNAGGAAYQGTFTVCLDDLEDGPNKAEAMAFLESNQPDVPHITLFPNPATGTTQLVLDGFGTEGVEIQLLDVTGQLVHTTLYSGKQHALNLRGLSPGVYLISATTPTMRAVERLIVE